MSRPLRIFFASSRSPFPGLDSNLWRSNLVLSLIRLGHDVVEFDFDLREVFANLDPSDPAQKRFIGKTRPGTSAELLRQVRAAHGEKPIDLFFSYFYDACVSPGTIDEIRGMGIRTVNWFCNGSYQLHLVREISPRYDWCLVPEKFRLADYWAMGARPIYCQEAANPDVYRPYDIPAEFDATFVGQAYGDRPSYIRYLLDHGIDVRVWGPAWSGYAAEAPKAPPGKSLSRALLAGRDLLSRARRQGARRVELPSSIMGGVLTDGELVRMYSRSRINLGFSTCGDTGLRGDRVVQVRLRDFEVPMSGGFYLVEYMEELEEFFEIGKEIVCFRGPEDLADKIRYYLRHESERETIRGAGRERSLRDHTWVKRFGSAFLEMGLA